MQKQTDVAKYQKLHKKIQNYIYRTYEIAERLERTVEKDFSQTELCMLLQYDLLQENDREKAQQMLLASVEKNEYRLVTGFVGTGLILRSLTDAGGAQSAYRLLLSEKNHPGCTVWIRERRRSGSGRIPTQKKVDFPKTR